MRKSLRHLSGGIGVLVATTALPFVTATPAQADRGACRGAVYKAGYTVGPKVRAACIEGEAANATAFLFCNRDLLAIGISVGAAQNACIAAAKP